MDNHLDLEKLNTHIYRLRGQQIMLDTDLAILYGIEVRSLIQAVKRNTDRFPVDFMFRLSPQEFEILRSHSVISSWGGRRYIPYAFTEQGIAMLSSVLRSRQAVQVNIAIMRAFVKLRHAIGAHRDLARRVEKVEGKVDLLGTDIRLIGDKLRSLKEIPPKEGPKVRGFQKED